jgi:hypothetical protein
VTDPSILSAAASWERPDVPLSFGIAETARRIGHYRWVELQIFEALGRWLAITDDDAIKLRLATHSNHHAWHAELWEQRLPVLREPTPDQLIVPANADLVEFFAALNAPTEPTQTLERLVGMYRVLLPRCVAAYTFHLNNTSRVTDASTARALELVLRDDVEQWRDGEMMIQSLLRSDAHVARASAHQARLETLMVQANGIAGAVTMEVSA